MVLISTSQLSSYTDGFSQAGVARQAAAKWLSLALERLADADSGDDALTAVGWTYADLQARISADPVGALRTTLLALLDLGAERDATAIALFGSDLADSMIRLGRVFELARLISADALASEQ